MESTEQNHAHELNPSHELDEAMLPLSEFLLEVTEVEGRIDEEHQIFSMELEKFSIGMPVQLDIRVDDNGNVLLAASPPLYYVETTIVPVFHQLQIDTLKFENV